MTVIDKITNQEQNTLLQNHLEQLKSGFNNDLNNGLAPQQYKETQAWIKAIDAAIKIIKSPKLQVLNP
ncbi:EscE/YscE/SsaE family type III secretion system needle protein co-chaperone [Pseudoalteromonas piratica]|uniref:EscE/YscE/SsaE family type III secretion system needle protein co-chaperone n=1 Tax=Pseudoalteromonas piratica TaxID=1348114 RepID=A0A0A7EJT2_9GAMM|nr:EscE/YscE/SsaE family type III secretion system needle protein co-chaperone [Pseudoalteromonas piratica]AIY66899.1 hypothetical protein OM33_17565 [Pseudoalteromonas piratica]